MNAQLSEDQNTITVGHLIFVANLSPLEQRHSTSCGTCAFRPDEPLSYLCNSNKAPCWPSERNDGRDVYFFRKWK